MMNGLIRPPTIAYAVTWLVTALCLRATYGPTWSMEDSWAPWPTSAWSRSWTAPIPPDAPDENPNDTDPGMTRTFRRLKKRPPAPRRAVNKDETLSPRRTPPMKPHVGMLPPREMLARLIPNVMEPDWSLSTAIFSSTRSASWAGLLALAPLLFLNSIRALMQENRTSSHPDFFSLDLSDARISLDSVLGGRQACTGQVGHEERPLRRVPVACEGAAPSLS